jgi:hypothetical protein
LGPRRVTVAFTPFGCSLVPIPCPLPPAQSLRSFCFPVPWAGHTHLGASSELSETLWPNVLTLENKFQERTCGRLSVVLGSRGGG